MKHPPLFSESTAPQQMQQRQLSSFLFRVFAGAAALFAVFCASSTAATAKGGAAKTASPAKVVRSHLLFCNTPEKIGMPGACADALLQAGHTYTIFYHFRNTSRSGGPFVVALHGSTGKAFRFTARQGMADPQRDPSLAGRQAMARYLSSPERAMNGVTGGARFACPLGPRQVASGVLTVRCESDAQLRIYFRHDKWTLPRSSVILVDTPRREFDIALSPTSKRQTFRIGDPEPGMHPKLDGTYGLLYAFHVAAPPGRRVRVSFSPRGGKGGLVGSINGSTRLTSILPAASWTVFSESSTGKNGSVTLTTAPFGGVFYPVELIFQLL